MWHHQHSTTESEFCKDTQKAEVQEGTDMGEARRLLQQPRWEIMRAEASGGDDEEPMEKEPTYGQGLSSLQVASSSITGQMTGTIVTSCENTLWFYV